MWGEPPCSCSTHDNHCQSIYRTYSSSSSSSNSSSSSSSSGGGGSSSSSSNDGSRGGGDNTHSGCHRSPCGRQAVISS